MENLMEPRMRAAVVRETLVDESPTCSASILREVFERLPHHGTTFDSLRDAIFDVLRADTHTPTGHLDYDTRKAIYEAASDLGYEEVMRVLRSTQSSSSTLAQPSDQLPLEVSEIPLGRRRSLAKGDGGTLLEKLAQDFDPVVIRNLLRNHHTKEIEVIRIASMRPVHETTLMEIHESQRWSNALRIRTALAQNPYCPPKIAIQIIRSLPLPELREIRKASHLHVDTYETIELELKRRQQVN